MTSASNLLFVDLEAFSRCNIDYGVDNYSNHESTTVLCVGYAVGDGPIRVVSALRFSSFFNEFIQREGATLVAHNAAFEMAMINNCGSVKYGWGPLSAAKVICTMAMSYAHGLPGSLGAASDALGITSGKDWEGHRVMMQLCKPRSNGVVYTTESHPAKFQKLYQYCAKDVETEREIYRRLRPLSPVEKKVWQLDYEINQRGLLVDRKSAAVADIIVAKEKDRLNVEMFKTTDGFVSTAHAHAALLKWVRRVRPACVCIDRAQVSALLTDTELPYRVKRALLIRQEASKTSTSKLAAMLRCASKDGRARDLYVYHRASTGRWAGRSIQPQNLKRPKLNKKQIEEVFGLLEDTNVDRAIESLRVYGNPIEVLSSCMRGFLVPAEGKSFIGGDFSNVEARITAWLSGQLDMLDTFASGEDVYKATFSKTFGTKIEDITAEQRNLGKVMVLSLGFGGAAGALEKGAQAYKVTLPPNPQQIVESFRRANPKICNFWYSTEGAALSAMGQPGRWFQANTAPIYFMQNGSFLICKLPSGREMLYPYPKLVPGRFGSPQIAAKTVSSKTRKFQYETMWHGTFVENCVQATARDLLVCAMFRLEKAGFPVVHHAHDEILTEGNYVESQMGQVREIARQSPPWAKGLPIDVECWFGKRYQK
jgi:DNA polymerase